MTTRTVNMMRNELADYISYLGRNGGILLGVRNIDHIQPEHVAVTFGYLPNNTL